MIRRRNLTDNIVLCGTCFAALSLCALLVQTFEESRGERLQGNVISLLQAGAGSADSLHKGSLVSIDVPITQLSSTRVGDQVKGSMPVGGGAGGMLAWTGQITEHTVISPKQGCVTVRVISDKYIAPGTQVSGTVGGHAFMGTVTKSPNKLARIGNIERRLSQLEPQSKKGIDAMKEKLEEMEKKLQALEGHQTMDQKVKALETHIVDLERRPPSSDGLLFDGNAAGFHFVGALGETNDMRNRIDSLDSRLSALEGRDAPEQAVKPLDDKLDEMEKRLDKLTGSEGRIAQRMEMKELATRLHKIEVMYGSGGGDNSKWYGTEPYHGKTKS
jgi:hypothetical protein